MSRIRSMSTISFSIEDEVKKDFNVWAMRAKKSKSDLFRDMVNMYKFNQDLTYFQDKTEATLTKLGIQTEDELYKYLESDETYQDRLRHQRLSRRNQKR